MSRVHNLPLVHALVGVAWANDEAQQQTTNQRVLARLQAASNEAHECALAVERDNPSRRGNRSWSLNGRPSLHTQTSFDDKQKGCGKLVIRYNAIGRRRASSPRRPARRQRVELT
ncbi:MULTISPECIES: hypothetical protein [unclassified Methylobacterium]|uniref:hypothetical protein n=1 Tax=unclassified Methylobacterium TaxID=2615210 RepID=UPI0011C1E63F|nr:MULTISPECIES: hypothetical protein [unclassified Methylobacterium]QEE37887.1 hypothetical protein FVA80_01870 [Methylobacterium sp. WL1]TXN59407.1 hypothetical protein FV241_02540 [Methylobacterium sp. WL2]